MFYKLRFVLLFLFPSMYVWGQSDSMAGRAEDLLGYCKSKFADGSLSPGEAKAAAANASAADAVAGMRCVAYLAGFVHGTLSIQTADNTMRGVPNVICYPPVGISTEQTRRIVVKWLEDHPERLHNEAALEVFFAILNAFPCKK